MLPPIHALKDIPKTPRKCALPADSNEGLIDDGPKTPEKLVTVKAGPDNAKVDKTMIDVRPPSFRPPSSRRPCGNAVRSRRHSIGVVPTSPLSALGECTGDADSDISTTPSPCGSRRYSLGAKVDGPSLDKLSDKGRPRFDVLTLRQWFTAMDSGRTGHVTKTDWFGFLRDNLKLKHVIVHGYFDTPRGKQHLHGEAGVQKRKEETVELRKLLKAWRQMDEDGNGTLEWEEFVAFFRNIGLLLEYKEQHHPAGRLASILGEMHENRTDSSVDETSLKEFDRLAKGHIPRERRRSLENTALQILA